MQIPIKYISHLLRSQRTNWGNVPDFSPDSYQALCGRMRINLIFYTHILYEVYLVSGPSMKLENWMMLFFSLSRSLYFSSFLFKNISIIFNYSIKFARLNEITFFSLKNIKNIHKWVKEFHFNFIKVSTSSPRWAITNLVHKEKS